VTKRVEIKQMCGHVANASYSDVAAGDATRRLPLAPLQQRRASLLLPQTTSTPQLLRVREQQRPAAVPATRLPRRRRRRGRDTADGAAPAPARRPLLVGGHDHLRIHGRRQRH